jgi:hypothetical protein
MAFIDLGDQFIALQKGLDNQQMKVAILVWSSMIKKRRAAL